MSILIKFSSSTQLWCLRHPNFLTRILLWLFYAVEVVIYSVKGAKTFLTQREDLFGPNYAALGRLIVGEYAATAEIIAMPQKRGDFLGRARLKGNRLPTGFLLALSDKGAGGDGLHETLASFFWDSLIVGAQSRQQSDPRLQEIVDAFVAEVVEFGPQPTEKQVTPPTQRMIIRYMMRVLFELDVTDEQVEKVQVLFYTGGPRTSYIAALVRPFALPEFLLGGLHKNTDEVVSWIEQSPVFADYQASDANANFSKKQWAELVMAIFGIAALGGSGNLVIRMLSGYPADQPVVNLDDDAAVMGVVLESARRKAPVNNINVILEKARSFKVNGDEVELPGGTVVAASIGLASLDGNEFPDPDAFNPHRDNLQSALLNFNSVGYQQGTDTGRRACPGRNVATVMGMSVFRDWRRALVKA